VRVSSASREKSPVRTSRNLQAKDEGGGGGGGGVGSAQIGGNRENWENVCDRVKNNNTGLGIKADRSADTRLDMAV
jgi:hypothetical protein